MEGSWVKVPIANEQVVGLGGAAAGPA